MDKRTSEEGTTEGITVFVRGRAECQNRARLRSKKDLNIELDIMYII